MTLYDLTKKYGEGKGEAMMWSTLRTVSDTVEQSMDKAAKDKMLRCLYEQMSKGHYDQDYAMADVAKMYYTDEKGEKHYAPYWTEPQVREVYELVKKDIPASYNFWDFYVALQMIKSDNCPMLRRWYPNITPEEMEKKIVEMTVNWLNDADNPYGDHKVWGYLSGK